MSYGIKTTMEERMIEPKEWQWMLLVLCMWQGIQIMGTTMISAP